MDSARAEAVPVDDTCAPLGGDGPTVGTYFEAFAPAPPWDELPVWPPDVFALTNLVLDHTEAYRLAVAPPASRRWPPSADWDERVASAARAWRTAAGDPEGEPPAAVLAEWDVVTRCRDVALAAIRDAAPWRMCEALLTLHAMADEACAGLAESGREAAERPFERRAWAQLRAHGSLSRLSPVRVRILPKSHFAARGLTIRSFSRYLALCYEAVDVRWQRTEAALRWPGPAGARRDFNIVLLPWPLTVRAEDFRPVEGPLDNMPGAFGFFEFAPNGALPPERLAAVLEAAHRTVQRIDVVILPEGSVDASEVEPIEQVLAAHRVTSLIAGVRTRSSSGGFAENRLHVGVRAGGRWEHLGQAKHHRWCLDERQIRQYHLTRVLDPARQWWEAIDLPQRKLQILDLGGGTTVAPLICEDLARLDEVADVIRRVGPSLVVAVLLDGPQLSTRWPRRYASVLAEEPGSAVLTLSSFGMVARSRPAGMRRSRAVALWNDARDGLRELELGRGASAVLVTASVGTKTVWTADGRCHEGNTPDLILTDVHQLSEPTARALVS